MEQLTKCGQVWVKFDEFGEPEYGFIVKGRDIQRLIMLCDKKIDTFVLPELEIEHIDKQGLFELKNMKKDRFYANSMKKYLCGAAKICRNCFAGFKDDMNLVVPGDYSIMIDHGAFERGTKQNFVLKDGMDIFQVKYAFSTPFDIEREWWHIIGHDVLESMPEVKEYKESYSFKKYSKEDEIAVRFDDVVFEVSHQKERNFIEDGGKQ